MSSYNPSTQRWKGQGVPKFRVLLGYTVSSKHSELKVNLTTPTQDPHQKQRPRGNCGAHLTPHSMEYKKETHSRALV